MVRFFCSGLKIVNRILTVLVEDTLNYSKTIQRLVLSFRNLHEFHSNEAKTEANFLVRT